MSLDFSGQSLVGHSFVGQDLTGANFSTADIRSANFTHANLTGANFHCAKAGLSKPWQLTQVLLQLVCSATIGVMLVVAGTFSGTFLIQENVDLFTVIPGLLSLLCFASISLPLMIQGFTPAAFQTVLVTGTLSIAGIAAGTVSGAATSAADAAGGLTGALVLLIADTVTLTVAGLTGGPVLIAACLGCSVAIARLSFPSIYPVAIAGITAAPAGPLNRIGMIILIATVLLCSAYVAYRVLAQDEKFALIQKVATTFTAIGGTCFQQATLTDTNFDRANLKCTNFSHANIKGTSFYHSGSLHTAQLANTIFSNAVVRRLAVYRNGQGKRYNNLNLQGINLVQADLKGADLTGSNLSWANLTGIDLTEANLTGAQAVGTQFQAALLTGACLQSWNIDSATQLLNVDCQYVYLQAGQQERRPSSGQFNPGEFTKLFQEIVDTVDLIFQGGIDWQALHTMLATANQQAQSRPGQLRNEPLSLRSIENKNDGVVVVRVDAPADTNKAELHQQLNQHYKAALLSLEAQYQQQLQAKDEQIAIYREHQANLNAIAQSLASRPVTLPPTPLPSKRASTKLVILKFHTHSTHNQSVPVTLQIGEEGALPSIDCTGTIPCPRELLHDYNNWQASYRDYLTFSDRAYQHTRQARISSPPAQVTNISTQSFQQQLAQCTQQIQQSFHRWLAADSFRALKETLLENLSPTDTIRIVLHTDTPELWQLPWQSWDLLNRYPNAEITFSTHQHHSLTQGKNRSGSQTNNTIHTENTEPHTIQILTILGDGDGLNISADCQLLQQLPNVQLTVLTEPDRQSLNNHLWEKSWDILFFAGHSNSRQGEGYLRLNPSESLSLSEISYGVRKACQRGLQLAIFNSCDGLGLAQHLTDLCLPNMIVMREPIPDLVAQSFLEGLLSAFADGQPLPQAVRDAREKLQGLENHFPCATWLPVLCQTAATPSLTWQQLQSPNI